MASVLNYDPYVSWLNVRDTDRPLNPYQILGLTLLEKDRTKIQAAIERQQEALELQRVDADPAVWHAINDELEKAISTLLDPELKGVLDAAIKRRMTPAAPKAGPGVSAASGMAAGAAITCRHCQKQNPANRRFCGSCGKPLWEQCPKCGAESTPDERFCGICGTDIQGGFDEQNGLYETRLEEALRLAREFHYEAAISALRGLASIDDARFESWALKALDHLQRLEIDRRTQLEAATASFTQAQECWEAKSFEAAMQAILEIPEPLRTAEMKDTLERSRSARNEVLSLSGEIRTAIEEKRTWDLLPKLERMLSLRPNHAQAQQLIGQLRDQFIRQAKKKLGEHKYADAIQVLEQIPSSSCTEESDTVLDKARELDSLLADIRAAALAEKTTLALADKLAKFVPTNTDAAKIREQLMQKAKTKPADPRIPAVNFAIAHKRTHLGPPVDLLGHFTSAESADEKVAATLREHPGEFFVALGLALQGLEKAQVTLNLLPPEKGSVLGKLNISFGSTRRGPLVAWGLDLSDFGLKAIKLSHDPKSKVTRVDACEYIPHRKPLTNPEAEIIRAELLDETLRDFAGRNELKDCRVCVAVAGQRVLGRFFDLPPMLAKKVPDAVQYEAKHQVPIPLGELRWAYQILDEVPGKAADDQPRRILLVAIRESHVAARVQTFKSAGIPVDIVQSEAVALHNAAVFEFFPAIDPAPAQEVALPRPVEEAVVLVDVGAEATNVVISSREATWFRVFSQGGEAFTSTLARQFHLNHEQAELLKRSPARARRYYQLREAITPLFVQIASEIERSISSYRRSFPTANLTRIHVLGGASQTYGLLRYLRTGTIDR